ncbi:hypothetical protein DSO57_1034610 [Entomophthora muscae]|uniref:Uncharacterized protein n=1 Tax=Entomophthora muscae TaxID=34485 RepID=A0ACC2TYB8_9FUNG|nr:hypothetical protein DSO57_1034610 [Entomophthora muscae]
MLYLHPEATCYKGLNLVTISKLKDNESQFITNTRNFCHRVETGVKTPYILIVKFLSPPLALDWDVFPRPSKKVACMQAKPLQNLEDLAHTVDERFVLDFPAEVPISPLESPLTAEETLIQLDCLLSWCFLVLKQLADQQKNAGCMEPAKPNLRPREIGYQILQSVVSQAANSSGPEVPWPKIIGF